ncbi:uncharacterized protein BJ171DRAFT_473443 [Polychytrium aggregatum]|uniref:uncharacterized protein n=1 Tax=Polychytrium aggregatum TaxID=110093 RepID=UPI0022FE99FC|nr:uncharacterized protein BJ171DRAFT_473443 [Polychytrium aggregatum]KAI9206442.1 hypothetical protein BJ171DRAFT_473443 [Polychytrium aggregatum]
MASNPNLPMAQFHLAGCYHNEVGVDQDYTKAVELYRSLADRGIPQAQIALGRCYENGEGVDQDYNAAIEWYSKAADQGSEDSRLHIVFLRGWFSFIGHGVEQSDVDAFHHWQEVSTESVDPVIKPIATHMLGWMHYLGRGTVRDESRGIKLIRENKSDRFPLGEDECLAGYDASRPITSASRRFYQLCELGCDRNWLCRHLVAICLINGFGAAKDEAKAAGIFEQLARDGHSDSQFWIGECYDRGLGVLVNESTSLHWSSEAASQGNSYGQWTVGYSCLNESGSNEARTRAAAWWKKSSEQGNRYGQCWLGVCYSNGYGVTKNIDTAVNWFRKSADNGHRWAIENLRRLGQWP